eukprot:TRINITY_DN8636_c0_g1_i1.p1 TRINITY_DN8636_c0_g1~~TRINITY_DN8636_c0_g1_i1.p1  ORF type:complete len:148 (-),score=15.51 TRINITY_DN8636_c0_g1_i1:152-595(-)
MENPVTAPERGLLYGITSVKSYMYQYNYVFWGLCILLIIAYNLNFLKYLKERWYQFRYGPVQFSEDIDNNLQRSRSRLIDDWDKKAQKVQRDRERNQPQSTNTAASPSASKKKPQQRMRLRDGAHNPLSNYNKSTYRASKRDCKPSG